MKRAQRLKKNNLVIFSVYFYARKFDAWQKYKDNYWYEIFSRDVRVGPKLGQIGPKWDKNGFFKDQLSVNFDRLICVKFEILV